MATVSSTSRDALSSRAIQGLSGDATGREQVWEIQRARILAAMTELVHERGVSGVAVAHVVSHSGVSRRTFYELFTDRGDCLLAAFECAVERAAGVVLAAYQAALAVEGDEARGRWEASVRAGLGALLGFLDEEPELGCLLVVDSLAGERSVIERRAQIVDLLIDAVHDGAAGSRNGRRTRGASARGSGDWKSARPPRIVAEGAVGAVLAVVHARLGERDPKPLGGLLNDLMCMVVLPYLGVEGAARELEHKAPRTRRRAVSTPDPLRDLDMRLTYRTVRVLRAISEQPRASSREVADASGVADQGQISKLLWRLEHIGLIANDIRRQGRRESNAWSLTPKGREVEQTIRSQTGR